MLSARPDAALLAVSGPPGGLSPSCAPVGSVVGWEQKVRAELRAQRGAGGVAVGLGVSLWGWDPLCSGSSKPTRL